MSSAPAEETETINVLASKEVEKNEQPSEPVAVSNLDKQVEEKVEIKLAENTNDFTYSGKNLVGRRT